MSAIIDTLGALVTTYGLRLLGAIAIVVIGRIVANLVKEAIGKAMRRSKIDETLVRFAMNLAYIAMQAVIIIAALGALGVPTTSLVAVFGAASLSIGLALKGSLSNFAAGVLLVFFKPFKVGDFIDAAGTAGIVEEISMFTTVLRTPSNEKIVVPNGKLSADNIKNFSAYDKRRIDLVIGVGYSDKLDHVKSVLTSIIESDERILKDPAPFIGVLELADSSVNLAVRPWVNSSDYWQTSCDLRETIKRRFDEEEISIPFPQTDIHLFRAGDQEGAEAVPSSTA